MTIQFFIILNDFEQKTKWGTGKKRKRDEHGCNWVLLACEQHDIFNSDTITPG